MRVPSKSIIQILADSHIAPVAIAVLLVWSFDWGFRLLWTLFAPAANFLLTALAIRGIPYVYSTLVDRIAWTVTLVYFLSASINLLAAWLLSRWVYGIGPLRCLSKYRPRLTGRTHV